MKGILLAPPAWLNREKTGKCPLLRVLVHVGRLLLCIREKNRQAISQRLRRNKQMDPITALKGSTGITAAGGLSRTGIASTGGAAGFGKSLEEALSAVSRMQNQAQVLTREFQAENPAVSLEETMIGMQQASLSFQAAVQVRNKLVAAYSEMMNMQV